MDKASFLFVLVIILRGEDGELWTTGGRDEPAATASVAMTSCYSATLLHQYVLSLEGGGTTAHYGRRCTDVAAIDSGVQERTLDEQRLAVENLPLLEW